MTRALGLIILSLTCMPVQAQEKPGPGEPGYVPPEVAEDPLTNQIGGRTQGFLEDTSSGLRVSKLWAIDENDFRRFLLSESRPKAQARAIELTKWGAAFGAGGSRQGSALLVHVIRCDSPDEATELLGLLRKNAEAAHGQLEIELPALEDVTLAEGVEGYAFDARPDLGKEVSNGRNAKLGFTTGRVFVYCEAIDNFGSASLLDLGRSLLEAIQADEAKREAGE